MNSQGDSQEFTEPRNAQAFPETGIPQTALFALSLLAGVAAIGSAIRALTTGSVLLAAFSLQVALLLHASLFVLRAARLRANFARACMQAKAASSSQTVNNINAWGDSANSQEETVDWLVAHYAHLRSLHYLFLGIVPTATIGLLAVFQLYRPIQWTTAASSAGEASAAGLLCLAATCVWLVFNRIFCEESVAHPDREFLKDITRESLVTGVIVAAAVVASLIWVPADLLTGKAMCVWILAICVEQALRLARLQTQTFEPNSDIAPAPYLLLRQALLRRGNPLRSLNMALETRLGVSLRSSWALRFTISAILPALLAVGLMQWGLSSLAVVPVDHLGIRESFGHNEAAALRPGLHAKLPWPFGRLLVFPAKTVVTRYVGFVEDPNNQPEFLWSKKHAQQEFALILGGGAELVAVDCMVYYKVGETDDQLTNYAYQFQNPEHAIEVYAYRALMERTQSATLEEILSTNRAEFADSIAERLREYCRSSRLGIEVVEFAVIGLHPPVEVAGDYLDVISARVDAERMQTEASGKGLIQIEDARRESATAVAEAKVESARRVGDALEESSEFMAIGSAYLVSPEAYSIRLWFEILENTLQDKPFVLVDASLQSAGGGILLDQRGDIAPSDPVIISRPAIP